MVSTEIFAPKSNPNRRPLRDLDKEIIRNFADGHSFKEVAQLLNIKEHYVSGRTERIRGYWACRNITQVVAVAIREGLI